MHGNICTVFIGRVIQYNKVSHTDKRDQEHFCVFVQMEYLGSIAQIPNR